MTQIELNLLLWIQENVRAGWLDRAMTFVSALGNGGFFWIVAALAFTAAPKTRKAGVCMCMSLLLMLFTGNLGVKYLVARARPCHIYQDVQMLVAIPSSYSFPSGHTASSFAAAFALLFAGSRAWKWAMPMAALIALSRLYLFVHFPTDVLGGFVLGLFCAWAGTRIVRCACDRRAHAGAED